MTRSAVVPPDDMKRIPGLFRRWELPEVFEPDRHYRIEEAGTDADGAPLVALYASNPGLAKPSVSFGVKGTGIGQAAPADSPVRRPCLLVTEVDLNAWLASAKGGERLVYHHGFLAIDRLALGSRLPKKDARELDRVAKAAMAAAEAGRAHLVQRRNGIADYAYIIVARGRHAFGTSRPGRSEARR